jgi:hypothetical protein
MKNIKRKYDLILNHNFKKNNFYCFKFTMVDIVTTEKYKLVIYASN